MTISFELPQCRDGSVELRKKELMELARELEIFKPRAVRKPNLISETNKTTVNTTMQNVWDDIVEKKMKDIYNSP